MSMRSTQFLEVPLSIVLGQFNVAPVLDFERDPTMDTPYNYENKPASTPQVEVDRNFNPFKNDSFGGGSSSSSFKSNYRKESSAGWESLYTGLQSEASNVDADIDVKAIEFESEEVTGNLFGAQKTERAQNSTFQLNKKFIISTLKNGMLVIDQHRAHTRILYEELLKSITVSAALSQQLLFPLVLRFSHNEIELLRGIIDALEQTGFIFSEIKSDSVEITGIPTTVSESEVEMLLEQLISDFENEVPENNFSQTDLLAKSLAKSMAVKSGNLLNDTEQLHIVNGLFACKEPSLTPFNKPVFITLPVEELEKKFM